MSRMKKLLLCLGPGLCVFIFCFAIIDNIIKRKKEGMLKNMEILEQLKFPPYLSFDCPFTTGLYQTIYKRESSLLRDSNGNLIKLSTAFQKLQEDGKATAEEVEAVIEFEKAQNDLSNSIVKMCSIPSLYSEIRHALSD